jgi:hypothetical protein
VGFEFSSRTRALQKILQLRFHGTPGQAGFRLMAPLRSRPSPIRREKRKSALLAGTAIPFT